MVGVQLIDVGLELVRVVAVRSLATTRGRKEGSARNEQIDEDQGESGPTGIQLRYESLEEESTHRVSRGPPLQDIASARPGSHVVAASRMEDEGVGSARSAAHPSTRVPSLTCRSVDVSVGKSKASVKPQKVENRSANSPRRPMAKGAGAEGQRRRPRQVAW